MKIKHLLAILIIAFFSIAAFAQNKDVKKPDRIITRDYKIIEGTISKMSEQTFEYSFIEKKSNLCEKIIQTLYRLFA